MKLIYFLFGSALLLISNVGLGREAKSRASDQEELEEITDEDAEAFFSEQDAQGLTETDLDVFDLHAQAARPLPVSYPEVEESGGHEALFISGAVVTGLGAATLVGSVITGTMALSRNQEIKNNCPKNECPPAYHDILKGRNTLALTTDVLLGVGSAVTAAGIVLIIVAKVKQNKKRELVFGPVISPRVAGATVKWRF